MTKRSTPRKRAWRSALAGKRVTVVGLGRFEGGVGATRWLCRQGAKVTVSDQASREALANSIKQLADCEVELHLGGHVKRDFTQADLLVVNPAVPKDLPLLASAEAAGVPRTSEMNLFLQHCPAPIVGITGSVGKSTTTAMTGRILQQRYATHVGGNIGVSLLESLDEIRPDHVVVLEMSSFQLEDVPLVGISPHVAVVTNLSPNHLDRHGTMDAYAAAKKNIFAFQRGDDVLVINGADPALAAWATEAPGRVDAFDPDAEPFELTIPGSHNQANAQAAWVAARQLGIDREAAAQALHLFRGLAHRLQEVAERGGIRYVNDSKCTTPRGAIAALEAFPLGRVVIIVGGYDKGVSFHQLGESLAGGAKAVIALGQAKDRIIDAVEACRAGDLPRVWRAEDLTAAVRLAREFAESGDVILLSPACASYDMFANYEERGEEFVRLVTN